jgi:hypothetical protein
MAGRGSLAVAMMVALVVTTSAQSRGAGESDPELASLLARVGAAVERYYERAQAIVWMEEVTFQSLSFDLMPDRAGYRRLNYDIRVGWEAPEGGGQPQARVQRELLRVNGRPPRPSDKPKCGDPPPTLPDDLDFLRPAQQGETRFTATGRGRSSGRDAITIDYRSRESGPGTIADQGEIEDCVTLSMPGSIRGRIWVDPETANVLQIEEHLMGPVDMRWAKGSKSLGASFNANDVVIERLDTTVVFRLVSFSDPDEQLMLPSSAETMRVIRNLGEPRMRKTQRFSNYRRFTADGRIVEE